MINLNYKPTPHPTHMYDITDGESSTYNKVCRNCNKRLGAHYSRYINRITHKLGYTSDEECDRISVCPYETKNPYRDDDEGIFDFNKFTLFIDSGQVRKKE